MSSAGKRLLHSLVVGQDITALLKLSVTEEHFGINEAELYGYITDHVRKYGSIPAVSTVEETFGISVKGGDEPLAYYEDILTKKRLQREIKKTLVATSGLLKDMNPDEALSLLATSTMALVRQKHGKQILDFREAKQVVMDMYKQKITEGDDYGIQFGWGTLDKLCGGLVGGDVVSYVGRPAMGKTFMLLYSAHHAWLAQKKSVLFVSMEMKPNVIMQRLAAMHSHKGLTKVKNAELKTPDYKSLVQSLVMAGKKENPLYVVDGNLSATVEDVWMLTQQLKPDVLFIDGVYLVRHPDKRLNKYARIEENAELIKNALATGLDIPVVGSYQFNREAVKVKKDQKAGLEHIAGSDAIGQLSSIVLGLMQEEGLETMNSRKVDILKGRGGEQGVFEINWDFLKMDFNEVVAQSMDTLTIK